MDFAYAVVHRSPVEVFFAEDEEVLSEILARKIIARTPGRFFAPYTLMQLRKALLEGQWGTALEIWVKSTNTGIEVYRSCDAFWTKDMLVDQPFEREMQTAPIFTYTDV